MDLHLRIAANNPAANIRDDAAILRAVVELMAAALAVPDVAMFVDPFMDIDRGYFVRHGLVDRRCNLRPAGMAVEALTAYLGDAAGVGATVTLDVAQMDGARVLTLRRPDRLARIVLPQVGAAVPVGDALKAGFAAAPLCVALDQPWVIALDQGIALTAADGAWPRSVVGPVMLVGVPA